jgi:hypothetical protein
MMSLARITAGAAEAGEDRWGVLLWSNRSVLVAFMSTSSTFQGHSSVEPCGKTIDGKPINGLDATGSDLAGVDAACLVCCVTPRAGKPTSHFTLSYQEEGLYRMTSAILMTKAASATSVEIL